MGEMAYKFFKDKLVKNRPEYQGTEFKFPILYGLTGAQSASEEMIDGALERVKQENGGHFLDALWLAEQVESGYDDHEEYFISDDRFRSSCLGLNQGTNAWALLVGGDNKLVDLAGLLQAKNFKIHSTGRSSSVLAEVDHIDYGDGDTGVVYFGQLLARYALIYARAEVGSSHAISHEIEENAPGVVFVTGELEKFEKIMVQSLLAFGVPLVILGESRGLVGMAYETETLDEMVKTAWSLPNVRARLVEKAVPDVPLDVGPIFSRENIEDPVLEIKGSENSFVAAIPNHEIKEEELEIIGNAEKPNDISILVELGNPVVDDIVTLGVEGSLLKVIKYIRGVQVNLVGGSVESLKASKEAVESGFKYEHLLKVIQVELRNNFPEIGPMRISVLLNESEVEELGKAIKLFKTERKATIDGATEESVEAFYGCMRCASFSLSHACTVSPDRPSQCGSSPWWVLKTQALLAPDNPYYKCTVIEKGELLDPVRGEYSGANKATKERTNGRVERVFLHSIFGHPHTACSCFQNVAYYIPELDGIGLINRGYNGEAPGGWTWTRLANNVAGYQNTDGFATFATAYLKSKKVFQADGGYDRIVWMTSTLKTLAGDSIPEERRDKIATEKEATTLEELKEFLDSS
jgi:acetyl-CoA decarbonylase/synthase complex subunit beta